MRNTPYGRALYAWRRNYFQSLLRDHNGSVSAASRALGINRTQVYRACKSLDVSINEFRPTPVHQTTRKARTVHSFHNVPRVQHV